MMDIGEKYSHMGSFYLPDNITESTWKGDYIASDLCPGFESYSTSSSNSTTWASAIVHAAEYAFSKAGYEERFSLKYVLKCLPEFSEAQPNEIRTSDIISFIAENGLMTDRVASSLSEDELCSSTANNYKFDVIRNDVPNESGLKNFANNGNPVIVLLALDLLRLQTVNSVTGTDIYRGATDEPSVYGILEGYEEDKWTVGLNVVPCEHIVLNLPVIDNETNANYAGIAGYAFSLVPEPISTEFIVDNTQKTLDMIPSWATKITFKAGSLDGVNSLVINRFPKLLSLIFEDDAERNIEYLEIDAPLLEELVFGAGSGSSSSGSIRRLSDALGRLVLNCPNLKTFVVGEGSLESIGVIQIDAIGESVQFEVESNGLKNMNKIEYSIEVSVQVDISIKTTIEITEGHVGEIVTEKIDPTTIPPTTLAPTTAAPTTLPPTETPTTEAPTTQIPTTIPPTVAPTTQAPTTQTPTTVAPTTEVPTTVAPTTVAPTTQTPTTQTPTTQAPTTQNPTTQAPTTATPTTLSPSGCHEGQIAVQLQRICKAYPGQESFEIYEGTGDNLVEPPIYQQSQCSAITTSICMNHTEHTIVMHDSYGDKWSSGSVVILSHDEEIISFTCNERYTESQMFHAETLGPICSEGLVIYQVVREYGANPSSSERLNLYYDTGDVLVSMTYNGVTTDAFTGCMKPQILSIELSGTTSGWNDDSYFTIKSESGVSDRITLKGSSSNTLYFHYSIGFVSFTEVTSCDDFNALPDNTTMIHMTNNACNDASIVEFSTTRFSDLVYLWIGNENYMYVKTFNVQNNSNLQYLYIQQNSFTQRKNSYGNDQSKSFHILNCESLESIEIDLHSFSDYGGEFELKNLPQLQSIQIGEIGSNSNSFRGSSFVIRGIFMILNIVMNRSS